MHDPRYTGRITVPVLWDRWERRIVSNDSWSLLKLLVTCFPKIARDFNASRAMAGKLWPPVLLSTASNTTGDQHVDELDLHSAGAIERSLEARQEELYDGLLYGVYRAGHAALRGGGFDGEATKEAAGQVHLALDAFEQRVAEHGPYLASDVLQPPTVGGTEQDHPTLLDVRLTMSLLRFDAGYRVAFGLNRHPKDRGGVLVKRTAYPQLVRVMRAVYDIAGVHDTVEWYSFRDYFRWGLPSAVAGEQLPEIQDFQTILVEDDGSQELPGMPKSSAKTRIMTLPSMNLNEEDF